MSDFFPIDNAAGLLVTLASGIALVVIGLMLFMLFRLYASNRKMAYLSLLLSLGALLVHRLLLVPLTLPTGLAEQWPALVFAARLLQTLAFIVLNFAVFDLYRRRRPRTQAWFYGLLGLAAALAAGATAFGGGSLTRTPALDVYILLLCPLFMLMFAPQIGQPRRYVAALSVFLAAEGAAMIDRYAHPGGLFLTAVSALLPIAFYVLLFMLLFERVVELLQWAYRSSITDGLTSLYNRRYFLSGLERALRSGRPVGVVFCDIDNFKRLNDTHGHQQADVVLKQAAGILMEETDGIGLAGRYGGEELVAFVVGAGVSAADLAEQIRKRIERETIVTVSVGFCVAEPGAAADQLMKRADLAMYHSKRTGKNKVTDFADIAASAEAAAAAQPRQERRDAR